MGLFTRKPKKGKAKGGDAGPVFDLQAELDAIKERLDASEAARVDLEARLQHIDDTTTAVSTRIGALDNSRAELDVRLDALDQSVATVGELDARLDELTARVEAPISSPPAATIPPPTSPPPPPPPPSAPVTDERADEMAAQLDALAAAVAAHTEAMAATQIRLGEIDDLAALIDAAGDDDTDDEIGPLREQLTSVTERIASVDGRVTSVSMELANQLTELSRDIDELNRRNAEQRAIEDDVDPDTAEIEVRLTERLDAAIDDVLDTTERLAAEQARYEIQFRADLAELAERFRRPNAS